CRPLERRLIAMSRIAIAIAGLGMTMLAGRCSAPTAAAPPVAPPSVTVSYPIEREVTDYAVFTGRMAPVDSVDLRARVWGYLDKVNFKEGAIVQKGEVLVEIDPLTYKAALNQAVGNLASIEARV